MSNKNPSKLALTISVLTSLGAFSLCWALIIRLMAADSAFRLPRSRSQVRSLRANLLGLVSKRIFDIVASALGLIVVAPLMLGIAIAIKLTSSGPVFYSSRRVGRHGRHFGILKFRTMVVDADKIGPKVTVCDDPRITRIGCLLRRTKLDELPQLINVLRGEMSLVGPRPEDPRYVALYTKEQRAVLNVAPGITSPASLRFCDEQSLLTGADWETRYVKEILPAKLAIDLEYAKRPSLQRDIEVITGTLKALYTSRVKHAA
jgi:lipopolysaccharide/colanic/teichoic acid biosynthesis glycosyltransferase